MSWASFTARTFDSLRNASYRRFFIGIVIAMTGFWMRIATGGNVALSPSWKCRPGSRSLVD